MENVLSTDELLRQIEALKEENEELKRENTQQRYGLIWEDSPEKLDDPNIVPLLTGDPDEYVERFVETEPLNKDILMDEEKPMNYLIEGDNYHSLKALERTHTGKIDVIYIDPPYNTGNEFVYNDKIVDKEDGYRHSKWLSFMSKRLEIARRLMSDDGVIFVSIDDNEQAQLKLLMDSIFGESSFIGKFLWEKNPNPTYLNKDMRTSHEYIYSYGKRKINILKEKNKGKRDTTSPLQNKSNPTREYMIDVHESKIMWGKNETVVKGEYGLITLLDDIYFNENGENENPYRLRGTFRFNKDGLKRELLRGRKIIYKTKTMSPRLENVTEEKGISYAPHQHLDYEKVGTTQIGNNDIINILGKGVFDYPKPTHLIKHLINLYPKKSIIVLDFFAGSGTTGHAVLELNKEDGGNRQFILGTNNEVSEEKVRNHFYEQGLIPKPNKTEFNKFKKENPDQVLDFTKSDEYQELGIARSVTYERLRRVIEGYTTPKGKEVEGIPANLMYLTTKEYTKDEVRDVRETGRFGKTTEMYAGLMYLKYPRTTHTVMFITDEVGFSNFSGIDTLPTENVVIVLSGLDYPHEIANIIRKEVKTKNLIFEYLKY